MVCEASSDNDDRMGGGLGEPLLPVTSGGTIGGDNATEHDEQQHAATTNTSRDDSCSTAGSGPPVVSRNIPIMLWYMFLRCGGEAVWLYSVFSIYLYLVLPDQPEMIGYVAALEGIAQFFAAIVAGVLADRYRRDALCKVASVIGFVASGLIVVSVTAARTTATGGFFFGCLVFALILNGAFDGIGLTASLALYTDSVREGDRSFYFTRRTLCTEIGSVLGPLCGIVMFIALGDRWTVRHCATVIVIAQLILVPNFILLCFFRDVTDNNTTTSTTTTTSTSTTSTSTTTTVSNPSENDNNNNRSGEPCQEDPEGSHQVNNCEEGEEHHTLTTSIPTNNKGIPSSTAHGGTREGLLEVTTETEERIIITDDDDEEIMINTTSDNSATAAAATSEEDEEANTTMLFCCFGGGCVSKSRFIAICAAGSDLLCSFAGGLSFRYYAVFFKDNLKLNPVIVLVLDALSSVSVSCLLLAVQRLSLRFGRSTVSFASKTTGCVLLLAMVVSASSGRVHYFFSNNWSIGILYLLQSAFLGATQALTRSLVMDNVPERERAKWSALESINIFGWCGSAAAGGMIVARAGSVLPVFVITAALQFVGALPLVAIFGIEEKEQPTAAAAAARGRDEDDDDE